LNISKPVIGAATASRWVVARTLSVTPTGEFKLQSTNSTPDGYITRLNIGSGSDVVDVTFSDANLVVNGNIQTSSLTNSLVKSVSGVLTEAILGVDYAVPGNTAKTIFTPTTGSTITSVNKQYNIINPSGALLALTITLPASPADGDIVEFKFTKAITTVTYTGGTVAAPLTSPVAGNYNKWVWDAGTSTWY